MIITPYEIEEIVSCTNGKTSGQLKTGTIMRLVTDSRHPFDPSHALFIAIKGDRYDGHKYIPQLRERGCRYFLVNQVPAGMENEDVCFIVVNDTVTALQDWAASHRKKFDIPVVAITGSNAKTIVKEWLFQLLKDDLFIVRSPKSYNSRTGVPISVLQTNTSHRLAIFEVGISQPGEMDALERVVQPTHGIFTNVGTAHLSNFKNKSELVKEKMKLFKNVKALVVSADHESILQDATKLKYPVKSWGKLKTNAFRFEVLKDGRRKVVGEGMDKAFEFQFTEPTLIENIMHAVCMACLIGVEADDLVNRAYAVLPIEMRLEVLQGVNDCLLVNDTYNLDLTSLQIALDFLARQKGGYQRTVILSDLFDYAVSSDKDHKEVAALLIRHNVNRVYVVGKDIKVMLNYFHGNLQWFETVDEMIRETSLADFDHEAILVKGSRQAGFDRIVSWLEKKTHRTCLEVDLNAVVANLNYYKSRLPAGTKMLVMVKAFGYGSGSEDLAATLEFNRVDYLAVAYPDEGISLRQAGIRQPVMVMNPGGTSVELMHRFDLEPEIYSIPYLMEVVQRSQYLPTPINVHIKLDTGMHRLGFVPSEWSELCSVLTVADKLNVVSVFTHLAAADDAAQDELTKHQLEVFQRGYDRISKSIGKKPLRHALNSAGIERLPDHAMDMVRLGIGLHGIGATLNASAQLVPVNTFKTVIS
ncbi:MAG: UDP-N-acetylmuramoyl-tripeptide--D-alanyl-D-alanine ligase, partial [Flavobacteriales bacterium]